MRKAPEGQGAIAGCMIALLVWVIVCMYLAATCN